MAVEPRGDARARSARRVRARRDRPPSSPAIRSANIRRWPRRGALALADAARLLKRRGQAMQRAVPVGEGAMAALLGLEIDAARRGRRGGGAAARSAPSPTTTAPGQVVVSGAHGRGRARRSRWPRSAAPGARSCCRSARRSIAPLMAPAADEMAEALAEVDAAAAARAAGRQCHRARRPATRRRSGGCWSSR